MPWTAQRLTYASGYGAGVSSPGWYAHLWRTTDHIAERWVARVAALLRAADLAASPASAVETVRLAEAVAAIRGRSLPGLSELTDAVLAVLCQGDQVPLSLINGQLVVGDELGVVPADVPTVPLHADFEATCRRLRFRPTATHREVELDLRGDTDRDRSRLLHRLRLLGIYWGEVTSAQSSGTFREGWILRWRPEYVVLADRAGQVRDHGRAGGGRGRHRERGPGRGFRADHRPGRGGRAGRSPGRAARCHRRA